MANRVRFVPHPNVNLANEQQQLVVWEREAPKGCKVSLAKPEQLDRLVHRENKELKAKLVLKEYKDCKDPKELSDFEEQRERMEVLWDSGK